MIPLVLDLDGTLVSGDTLAESALRLLARNPLALMGSASLDRALLKQHIARRAALDPASLAYNGAVLALAKAARGDGRSVVLATAADASVAHAVAAHLGLFDSVLASDGQTNLKGSAKADALVARFGAGGFDYAGDAAADLPVWAQARRAFVVSPSAALLARARAVCPDVTAIGAAAGGRPGLALRAMRPHQWAKNLLVFVPVLAAHHARGLPLLQAGIGFLAFSLCASSVYLLNDMLDLPHDRLHATKRRRPFASGALPLVWGPVLTASLLGATLLIAAVALPPAFLAMLAIYYASTLAYSFVLKRHAVWDVVALAGLYTLRIFAGAAATATPISPWLLAFSLFLFFCLAIVKRLTELIQHARAGGENRLSGRGYRAEDLDMLRSMAASSGTMSVLVLALYINSAEVVRLYRHPSVLWALCPILLFWVSRVLMLSNRGLMNDDPVVFALRDRVSLLAGAASLAAVLVAAS